MSRPPKRWEQPLGRGLAPKDPDERVDWLLERMPDQPDPAAAALTMVLMHGQAALRARAAALDAIADDTPGSGLRAAGEASMAVVALYLAAHAARLYCDLDDNPGPLGRRRLDELVSSAEHMRNCVLHWDRLARSRTRSFVNVTDHDVVFPRPRRPRHRDDGRDHLAPVRRRLDRLLRWADVVLEEHLASLDDADVEQL